MFSNMRALPDYKQHERKGPIPLSTARGRFRNCFREVGWLAFS